MCYERAGAARTCKGEKRVIDEWEKLDCIRHRRNGPHNWPTQTQAAENPRAESVNSYICIIKFIYKLYGSCCHCSSVCRPIIKLSSLGTCHERNS